MIKTQFIMIFQKCLPLQNLSNYEKTHWTFKEVEDIYNEHYDVVDMLIALTHKESW